MRKSQEVHRMEFYSEQYNIIDALTVYNSIGK